MEMMLESKLEWFSYLSSKWVVKQWRQLKTSTRHLPRNNCAVVQEVLQRRQEPWRGGAQWSTIRRWQWPIENHHRSWSSYNYTRSCWRTEHRSFYGHLAFEADWKGEKAQLSESLMRWPKIKKNYHFEVLSSLILCNNNKPFLRLQRVLKSGIYRTTGNNQLSGWTKKQLQSTFQGETCTRKGHGHCLWSAAHLSHYSLLNPGKTITSEKYAQQIDEMHFSACSQHWWTERAQFFQATVPDHPSHNLCFRSWANSATFASSAIFTWPLDNHLPLLQAPQ